MGVMNQHTKLEGTTDMGQKCVESRGEHHQNSWILWMSLVLTHHHVSAIIWQDLSLEKLKHSIIHEWYKTGSTTQTKNNHCKKLQGICALPWTCGFRLV